MTKEEFFNLDYGMVVKRNQHPELYEIDETDVFGAERDGRGREYRVLGMTCINGEKDERYFNNHRC